MTFPVAARSVFCAAQSFALARPIASALVINNTQPVISRSVANFPAENDEIATKQPMGRDVCTEQESVFEYENDGLAIAQTPAVQGLEYF